jgi:hypothetical protein
MVTTSFLVVNHCQGFLAQLWGYRSSAVVTKHVWINVIIKKLQRIGS